jgi:hypothetical protein
MNDNDRFEGEAGGNVNELWAQLGELVGFVEHSARERIAVHEVEKRLWKRVLELGGELLELFFRLCGSGDEGERVTLPDGRQLRRLEALHQREYLSVFGRFLLERAVYGTWEGRKIEYVPLDGRLQLPEAKFSHLLVDWNQSLAVETPYAQVTSTLSKILGLEQSVHSLERSNRQLAKGVPAFWANQPTPPPEDEGALMVCTGDGKGVPIRGAAKAPAIEETKPAKGPKPGRKKIALVGSAYTVNTHQRTPKEVLEALFRAPDKAHESSPPSRPKPLFKHVRASLIRDAAGTSLPSYDEIFGWMGQEVSLRNAEGNKPIILLMDGQETLWSAALRHLPEALRITEILDIIHAASYLWTAAHVFHPSGSDTALAFVKERIDRLLHGEVNAVIRGLRWMSTRHHLKGNRAETIETICGYFAANAHRMAYDKYLQEGYPIASGVIEGACRHVVKDRMERSGMRWILHGAHAMLGLRAIYLSGLWDEFMQFHIAQQTRRLYPSQAANDADLTIPLAA